MSPIHDQGYRRYGGVRTPAGRAWSVIAKAGIRTLIRNARSSASCCLSWVPFLVRAVQIYAATNLPQASFLTPDAKMFRQFLEQQEVFLFFITVYAGSGLIANDRRANALQIYLSKPLTRMEYIFGKMAILMAFLLLVTWVPAVLLLIIADHVLGQLHVLRRQPVPVSGDHGLLADPGGRRSQPRCSRCRRSRRAAATSASSTPRSSSSRRRSTASSTAITRDSRLAWMSVASDLAQIGDAIFRVPRFHMPTCPLVVASLVVAGLIAIAAFILERRVRGIEVVA